MDFMKQLTKWIWDTYNGSKVVGLLAGRQAYDRSRDQQVVKNRHQSLEERYRVLEDQRQVEVIFKRLAEPLLDLCDEVSAAARGNPEARVVLRELGTTDDRRSYVYMKPMSEQGWLMERGGAGWRVSRAEKIIGQSMFMRSHQDPWEVATVWHDPQGQGLSRIRSQRFGHELLTMSEYERRLAEALRDMFTNGSIH
jgi:hypothetical protein